MMAVLNILRAGRKNCDYMEKLIANMYNDDNVIFKRGYGVCEISPEMIIHSFYSIRNTCAKINPIKVHYMEICIEYELGMVAVTVIADNVGRYFYNSGFQSFVTVTDTGDAYMIAIAVNAVSFKNGELFHDNNAQYIMLYQYLRTSLPVELKLTASENAFFNPRVGDGNYVHGRFA